MATAGLELLFHVIRNNIKSKEDALVAVFHWFMIRNGNKCVGIDDQWNESSQGSELLPPGWNNNQEVYSLRYVTESNRFLLKIVKAGPSVLINVMAVDADKAAGMSVSIDDHVLDDFKDFNALIDVAGLEKNFMKEVLEKVASVTGNKDPITSKNTHQTHKFQALEGLDLRVPESLNRPQHFIRPDPFSVGRADLDPLARGSGGGMIMDPRHTGPPGRSPLPDPNWGIHGGLPRGAVPPGARFDPFGPPIPDMRSNPGPNPDHLRPPGYDDMFL